MEDEQPQSNFIRKALKSLTRQFNDLADSMRTRTNVPDAFKLVLDEFDDSNSLSSELREAHRQAGYAVLFAFAKLDTLSRYPHADGAFHFIAPRVMTSPEGLARHLSVPHEDFSIEIARNGKKHGLVFLYPYWCQEFSGFPPILYRLYQEHKQISVMPHTAVEDSDPGSVVPHSADFDGQALTSVPTVPMARILSPHCNSYNPQTLASFAIVQSESQPSVHLTEHSSGKAGSALEKAHYATTCVLVSSTQERSSAGSEDACIPAVQDQSSSNLLGIEILDASIATQAVETPSHSMFSHNSSPAPAPRPPSPVEPEMSLPGSPGAVDTITETHAFVPYQRHPHLPPRPHYNSDSVFATVEHNVSTRIRKGDNPYFYTQGKSPSVEAPDEDLKSNASRTLHTYRSPSQLYGYSQHDDDHSRRNPAERHSYHRPRNGRSPSPAVIPALTAAQGRPSQSHEDTSHASRGRQRSSSPLRMTSRKRARSSSRDYARSHSRTSHTSHRTDSYSRIRGRSRSRAGYSRRSLSSSGSRSRFRTRMRSCSRRSSRGRSCFGGDTYSRRSCPDSPRVHAFSRSRSRFHAPSSRSRSSRSRSRVPHRLPPRRSRSLSTFRGRSRTRSRSMSNSSSRASYIPLPPLTPRRSTSLEAPAMTRYISHGGAFTFRGRGRGGGRPNRGYEDIRGHRGSRRGSSRSRGRGW